MDISAESYLQLPSDLVWFTTSTGAAVYSNTGAVLLEGEDAGLLTDKLFPLLDGTCTPTELIASIPEITAPELNQILRLLKEHGIIEAYAQPGFTSRQTAARQRRIANARILLTGAEPWTTATTEALHRAGTAHVNLTMDFSRASQADIIVAVFAATQTSELLNATEFAQKNGTRLLTCMVGAKEVFIGPLALPGQGPCWNCAQMRMAANTKSQDFESGNEDTVIQDRLLISKLLAREICEVTGQGQSQMRLADRILVLDSASMQTSLHHVLPVPGCKLCGGPTKSQENAVPALPVPGLADEAMRWFVDARTGIIRRLIMEDVATTGVDLPVVANAIPADAPGQSPTGRQMPVGWGKGISIPAAILSAVGEAVERYSASMPEASRIAWARMEELPGAVLDPGSFALYGDEQYARPDFPFVRFDPEVRHPWVAGEWLESGGRVWVPAILTWLAMDVRKEHVFCQGSSNGLAAGTTRAESSLRAVLELLERDAFMASWRTRQPGQHVRLDESLDTDLLAVVNGIRALGANVVLIMLKSACGYPTALCLGFGDGIGWPGVTLGLGTDPDARSAARQAILELGQTGPYLRRLMRSKEYSVPAAAHDVKEMLDHAGYYFPAERASAFNYLLDDSNCCSFTDLPYGSERSLAACSCDLAAAGIRVALVDVTSSDIATTPFRVMRAVSPDLQAISFGYGLERESVTRLIASGIPASKEEIAPIW